MAGTPDRCVLLLVEVLISRMQREQTRPPSYARSLTTNCVRPHDLLRSLCDDSRVVAGGGMQISRPPGGASKFPAER
jgi:hypothetical protein